jgi:hypothetical protein
MRRAILLASLVVAVGIVTPATGLGKAGGTDHLPLKGKGSGTATVDLDTGEFHATMRGQVSHLGLTTFKDDGFVFPTGPPGQFGSVSHIIDTGASGAKIEGDCTGTGTTSDGVHITFLFHCTFDASGRPSLEGKSGFFDATIQLTRIGFDPTTNTVLDEVSARAVGQLSH